MEAAYEKESCQHDSDCDCHWAGGMLLVPSSGSCGSSKVGLDGQPTNTMPKLLAIAVPVGVSVVGSVMHLTIREGKNTKGFVLAVVGIAILILSLLFNR